MSFLFQAVSKLIWNNQKDATAGQLIVIKGSFYDVRRSQWPCLCVTYSCCCIDNAFSCLLSCCRITDATATVVGGGEKFKFALRVEQDSTTENQLSGLCLLILPRFNVFNVLSVFLHFFILFIFLRVVTGRLAICRSWRKGICARRTDETIRC
jgi:hypothetical protein